MTHREKVKANSRRWRVKNPEKSRMHARRWRLANPEKARAGKRRWSLAHPEKVRAHRLYSNYRIRPSEYAALFAAQGGVCAICKKPAPNGRRLHVDHDHETKTVRGLLCVSCNQAIGGLGDTFEAVEVAFLYLLRARGMKRPHQAQSLLFRQSQGE